MHAAERHGAIYPNDMDHGVHYYPKFVIYMDGSFRGNYKGIPAVKIEDWLLE